MKNLLTRHSSCPACEVDDVAPVHQPKPQPAVTLSPLSPCDEFFCPSSPPSPFQPDVHDSSLSMVAQPLAPRSTASILGCRVKKKDTLASLEEPLQPEKRCGYVLHEALLNIHRVIRTLCEDTIAHTQSEDAHRKGMEWQIHSPRIEVSPKIPIDELRTSLRQSITEVTQILTFLKDEVAEKEAKAKQFKAELISSQMTIARQEREAKSAVEAMKRVREQCRLVEAMQELTEQRHTELLEELRRANANVAEGQMALERAEASIHQERRKALELEAELARLRAESDRQVAESRSESTKMAQEFEGRLAQTQEAMARLQQYMRREQEANAQSKATWDADRESLTGKCNVLAATQDELQRRIAASTEEVTHLRSEAAEATARAAVRQQQVLQLAAQLAEVHTREKALGEQVSQKETALQAKTHAHNDLQERVTQLMAELEAKAKETRLLASRAEPLAKVRGVEPRLERYFRRKQLGDVNCQTDEDPELVQLQLQVSQLKMKAQQQDAKCVEAEAAAQNLQQAEMAELQVAILVASSELDRLRTERDDEASPRRALEQRLATAAMAIPSKVNVPGGSVTSQRVGEHVDTEAQTDPAVEDTVGIDTTLASLLVQVASLEHTCCALDAEHEKAMVIAQRANEDRAEMEHVLDAAICQQQVLRGQRDLLAAILQRKTLLASPSPPSQLLGVAGASFLKFDPPVLVPTSAAISPPRRDLQDEGGEAAMRPEDDRAGSARAVSPPAPFPVAVGDADGAFTAAILTASEASKAPRAAQLQRISAADVLTE